MPLLSANDLGCNTHLVHHREVQIRERSLDGISDVAARMEQAIPAAAQESGQIVVIVISAKAASVRHHDVIEQRPIAVRRRFQFLEEVRELLHLDSD